MLIPRVLLGLVAVVTCGGACGGGGGPAADALVALDAPDLVPDAPPNERRELQVEPGATVEVALDMLMDARVSIELDASAAITWNVHHHVDGTTVIDRAGSGTVVVERFAAPVEALYGIDLENQGAVAVDVTVDLTLGPGVTFNGWPP